MNMLITYHSDSSEVFVTIDGKEHKADQLFGTPADDSGETFERWIRMNIHFWMFRTGFNDNTRQGENWSTTCPFEIR